VFAWDTGRKDKKARNHQKIRFSPSSHWGLRKQWKKPPKDAETSHEALLGALVQPSLCLKMSLLKPVKVRRI
jgi:hypothetical protein